MVTKVLAILIHPQKPLILVHEPDFEDYDCLRMPGGGVEPGESFEDAIERELFEECGLTDIEIVRKVGMIEYASQEDGNERQRHAYLLRSPKNLPDSWQHVGTGDGPDAEVVFTHFWVGVADFGRIEPLFQPLLTQKLIPELY